MILRILRALRLRVVLLINYFEIKRGRVNRTPKNHKTNQHIFFDLKDLGLESYYAYLILSFLEKGCRVSINDNLWFLANCKSHMRQLLHDFDVPITKGLRGTQVSQSFLVFDLPSTASKLPWKKIIHIKLQIYKPKIINHLNMPYQMSPHIYLTKEHIYVNVLRSECRSIRIFFSGNQNASAYNSRVFQLFFQKMNRLEIVQEIRSRLTYNQFETTLPTLGSQEYLNKMILLNWTWSPIGQTNLDRRIENKQWLKQLAQSHFFLCPPGIRTPFCHHTIESMAVGTIPILEYAELFDPPLVHMENAIVFSGPDDLIKKIEMVLSLEESAIMKMQHQVGDYYDQYLQLSWTAEQIMKTDNDHIDLYINGEEKSYTPEMKKMI